MRGRSLVDELRAPLRHGDGQHVSAVHQNEFRTRHFAGQRLALFARIENAIAAAVENFHGQPHGAVALDHLRQIIGGSRQIGAGGNEMTRSKGEHSAATGGEVAGSGFRAEYQAQRRLAPGQPQRHGQGPGGPGAHPRPSDLERGERRMNLFDRMGERRDQRQSRHSLGMTLRQGQRHRTAQRMAYDRRPAEIQGVDQRGQHVGLGAQRGRGTRRPH